MRWALAALWLLLTTAQTHAYTQVWRSNVTLWAHAARMAPMKPRPAMNYGVSLMAAGQLDAGLEVIERAAQLADGAHVPWYDRQMTFAAASRNMVRARRPINFAAFDPTVAVRCEFVCTTGYSCPC